ncbi:MAG: D-alanyl-D-alanine carboxypeptidase/D-alanyl-D-alanine-endopeptidase [Phycisphaerales bacterium]
MAKDYRSMFKSCVMAGALLATLAGGVVAAESPKRRGELTDDVQRMISSGKLGNAKVGVCIIDQETGEVLAAVNAERPLTPASNQKLLTSGVALMALGPDFVFKTELVRDGARIIIRGGGDPALADPEILDDTEPKLSVDDIFRLLAEAVKKEGMAGVSEVVVDDRIFDREFLHPEWPERNHMMPHSAQIAGLNFNANVMAVFVKPSREGAGRAPSFSLEPSMPWLPIENRARTVTTGQNSPWLSREPAENRFVLRGDVRQALTDGIRVPIHNPPELFGNVFAQNLNAAGVPVAGGVPSEFTKPVGVRMANTGEDFSGGKVIAVVTTPMSHVLERCNADSMNLYAEALLKRVGHHVTKEPGSWANGSSVMRMMITEKLGAEYASSTVITDGSGISRSNSVSPMTFARWMNVVVSDRKLRDIYCDTMARPGSGTLRKRFQGVKLANDLRAKSGFIDGVRTLSGFVIDKESGRRVAFSVMVNDIKTGDQTQSAIDLHEDVVVAIDKWLERQGSPKLGG